MFCTVGGVFAGMLVKSAVHKPNEFPCHGTKACHMSGPEQVTENLDTQILYTGNK